MLHPSQYAKAITSGVAGLLAALVPVMEDGLTLAEVLTAVVAGLVASGLTYTVPNRPAPGHRSDPALSEQGSISVGEGIVIAAFVLAFFFVLVPVLTR